MGEGWADLRRGRPDRARSAAAEQLQPGRRLDARRGRLALGSRRHRRGVRSRTRGSRRSLLLAVVPTDVGARPALRGGRAGDRWSRRAAAGLRRPRARRDHPGPLDRWGGGRVRAAGAPARRRRGSRRAGGVRVRLRHRGARLLPHHVRRGSGRAARGRRRPRPPRARSAPVRRARRLRPRRRGQASDGGRRPGARPRPRAPAETPPSARRVARRDLCGGLLFLGYNVLRFGAPFDDGGSARSVGIGTGGGSPDGASIGVVDGWRACSYSCSPPDGG